MEGRVTELAIIATQLEAARCPEEVFGFTVATVNSAFRHILRVVHPDFNASAPALAQAVTARLNMFKTLADQRIKSGTYGKGLPLPEYEVIELAGEKVQAQPIAGDVADVYVGADRVVKVARAHDDNDLLRAERKALLVLNKKVMMPIRAGFVTLVTEQQLGKREVNVLEVLPKGFVTLEAVRRSKGSVESRALVWIFKRLLSVLDWTHHCGFVHGGVLPQHVWVYPDNDGTKTNPHPYKHTIRLTGWCSAVEYASRTRLSTWVPAWKSHYPPELVLKQAVVPASDIYMAAQLIDWLSDDAVPSPLQDVLRKCLQSDVAKRYQSCGEVFQAWVQAAEQAYGPPKWVEFNL